MKLKIKNLKISGLKPGERTANAQVQLLSRIHRQRLVQVWLYQLGHCLLDFLLRDGREMGSEKSIKIEFFGKNLNTTSIKRPTAEFMDRLTASITSKQMFSPSLSQSSHSTRKSQFFASDARNWKNKKIFMNFFKLLTPGIFSFGLASLCSIWQLNSSMGSTRSQELYFAGKSTA